jgi:hypothetical protein
MVVASFVSYSTTLTDVHLRQLARMAARLTRGNTVSCAAFTTSSTVVSSAGLRRATMVCRHLQRLVPGLRVRVITRAPLSSAEARRMGVRPTSLMRRVLVEISP